MGKERRGEENPSIRHPYVRKLEDSLVLDTKTNEGRPKNLKLLPSKGKTSVASTRSLRSTARRTTTFLELPELVCSTPVCVTPMQHEH